jgi:glycosyltransferase involved in cell wall biosynthesis
LTTRRPQVAIVQAWVPDYRVPFHRGLRRVLDQRGIDFVLVHGYPHGDATSKLDGATVDFAHVRDNQVLRVGSKELTWQSCYRLVESADLVIGDQQSARLTNYALWFRHLAGRQRFALWGLGRNFYTDEASTLGEMIKRVMSKRVHWWFAYNDMSASIVERLGFPSERITSVNNAIDTRELTTLRDELDDARLDAFRKRAGVRSTNVAVHLSSLHRQKRIPYMLEAAEHVRRMVPDFELVIVGSGPLAQLVEDAARRHAWIHYLGRLTGIEKVAAVALAKLMFMPGNVGLAVLDSFALSTPLVSLADALHGPEMAYLQSGVNGLLVPPASNAEAFAFHVADLLRDDARLRHLVAGAGVAGEKYTIEHMVDRFADGVQRALAA